jgi:peptidoglycan-associated lipoprotein
MRFSSWAALVIGVSLVLTGAGCAKNKSATDAASPAARAEAEGKRKDAGSMGEGELLLKPVYFDFDQATVRESELVKIKDVAAYMKKEANSKFRVRAEGHADDRGSAEYNMVLGQRRADAVRDVLIALGIDGSRLQTVSYGEEFPVVRGSGEESWAQNRRVEFVLLRQ